MTGRGGSETSRANAGVNDQPQTLEGGAFMNRILAFTAAAALALTTATAAFAADVTLRITLQLPMKSHLGQNLQLFKSEVEKLSGGEIAVEI